MAKMPESVGPYRVLREIGRGGMGMVYEVRHPSAGDRPLALKLILPHLAEGTALTRFGREAQLLARVSHPNVVRVVELGRAPEGPFLVTDLIEGESLHKVAVRRALAPRAVAAVIRDLARALEAIHQAGVLHRDLKPENVILKPDGAPVLLDFGLARSDDVDRLTRTGVVMGTPNYMAPEQADGMSPTLMDGRVDVYGLGGIMFTLLSGELPLGGESRVQVVQRVLKGELDWPAGCEQGPEGPLWTICRKAMATDREQRFATPAELAAALDAWLGGGPRRPRPRPAGPPRAAIAAALLLLLGAGGFAGWWVLRRRGPGGGGEPVAPATEPLVLEAPASDGETIEAQVLVKGRVQVPLELVKVKVGDRPAQRVPGAGGTFELPFDLAPGKNDVKVLLTDLEGNVLRELTRALFRHEVEPWVRELEPALRPPIPLPAGLSFSKQRGEYVNAKDGSVLVWVHPGTFWMGSDQPSKIGAMAEGPPHQVTLTRGFFIAKLEVSWAQFERFCRETRQPEPPKKLQVPETHPFHFVSALQALAYCKWAELRLPSEVEWEYAARGSADRRVFPWGDAPEANRAAVDRHQDPAATTDPVGSHLRGASPFGCLDMVGNVAELAYQRLIPYGPEPVTDPPCGDKMGDLIFRSAGYNAPIDEALLTRRWSIDRRPDHGFRVARSAE